MTKQKTPAHYTGIAKFRSGLQDFARDPGLAEQVIFAGRDGWLYSFRADEGHEGKPQPLWEFDCNPKEARFNLNVRSPRNQILAMPMIHDRSVPSPIATRPPGMWPLNLTRPK